jgi:hypothetical protein
MSAEPMRDVTVRLNDVKDFLEEPDPGADREVSGIEELYRAIKVHTRVLMQRPRAYRVTIQLPRDKITGGLGAGMRARIQRYCLAQTEQRRQDLRILHQQGIDTLWTGLFVLAPCFLLGALATWLSQSGVHGFLQALLIVAAAFFVLSAGWVALWFPAEYFLYDPGPLRQDMRAYQQMANAEVVISERHADVAEAGSASAEWDDSAAPHV